MLMKRQSYQFQNDLMLFYMPLARVLNQKSRSLYMHYSERNIKFNQSNISVARNERFSNVFCITFEDVSIQSNVILRRIPNYA